MKYDITKFNPCDEAIQFYNQFDTPKEAWDKCPRGDWMLWIASKLQVDYRELVLAKALCSNTVRYLMKDNRSKNAVYVAFMYGREKATKDELRAAAYAAYAAADAAADADYATYATYAAAYAAADAAAYAADAAAYAADATYTAAYAATTYAAYAAAAKKTNQMKTADICRKILTECVFEKIEGEQK